MSKWEEKEECISGEELEGLVEIQWALEVKLCFSRLI